MTILELRRRLHLGGTLEGADPAKAQRLRMGMAVLLLLAAIIVVIARDHAAWFESNDGDLVADSSLTTAATATPAPAAKAPAPAPADKPKLRTHAAEPVRMATPAAKKAPVDQPPIVASNRKALPPLDIEVVAGDNHKTVHAASKSIRVETAADAPALAAPSAPVASTAQRVTMSADATQAVDRTVEPSYPTLARQMKVQGAVVLQALIGADGLIQDLKVVSGPTILATAAREAVRQWHFKPYLEKGKAVETQAKITVNFTISTF